jgi:hypothetical protein
LLHNPALSQIPTFQECTIGALAVREFGFLRNLIGSRR